MNNAEAIAISYHLDVLGTALLVCPPFHSWSIFILWVQSFTLSVTLGIALILLPLRLLLVVRILLHTFVHMVFC